MNAGQMRNVLLAGCVAILFSCASNRIRQDVLDDEVLCRPENVKKTVFTIAAFERPYSGIHVKDVAQYSADLSAATERVFIEWMQIFLKSRVTPLSDYPEEDKDSGHHYRWKEAQARGWFTSSSYTNDPYYLTSFAGNSGHLVRTSNTPINFVFCDEPSCPGLKDPLSGKELKESESQGKKYFYVDGIEAFSRPVYGVGAYDWNMHGVLVDTIIRTGFNPGLYLSHHYFDVPEMMRESLCKKAGFEADCFVPPTEKWLRDYQEYRKTHAPPASRAHIAQLIRYTGGDFPDNGAEAIRLSKELRESSEKRRLWIDAVARDVFQEISIRQTRSVQGPWVITRVEWDPSLYCKYAKPNTILFTN